MQVQTLDVISVNIWQILISLLNLIIMFLILKRFLFKPVMNVMAQRRGEVDKIYGEADKCREEAVKMKQEYETNLSQARAEADSIVSGAKQAAERKGEAIVSEATAAATRIKAKADEEIRTQKAQMLQDVRGEIADIAVSIASKVVEREVRKEDHESFVEDFIRNVGDKQ